MSRNQYDSSAVSLLSSFTRDGFYYLPQIKDDSVSPRFCEVSPRKPTKKSTKNNGVGSQTKVPGKSNINGSPMRKSEDEVLSVRRLAGKNSPRPLESPLVEPEPEPEPEQIIIARKFKRRPYSRLHSRPNSRVGTAASTATVSSELANMEGNVTSGTATSSILLTTNKLNVSTEYVHQFIDEDDDNDADLPSPYLIFDQPLDLSLIASNNIVLETAQGSLIEPSGSTLYNPAIISDYRYILDPSLSPTKQEEPSLDSVFSDEFLTYSAIHIGSRPNSVDNGGSASKSRRNSRVKGSINNSINSPVTKSISINLGNSPSGIVTVEDTSLFVPTIVPNPPITTTPHSSNYISNNVNNRKNSLPKTNIMVVTK